MRLVLIDCPGFNRRVGRAIRAICPQIPITFYVSPSVWAWRPGRAREMRPYVDQLLALLPFEPAIHEKLGRPPLHLCWPPDFRTCRRHSAQCDGGCAPGSLATLRSGAAWGSRRLEIKRLSPIFAEVVQRVEASSGPIDWVLPAVPHLIDLIRDEVADWPVKPRIVTTEPQKFEAFRSARAALACSGTVTLELAVAGVPHVVAYRAGWLEAQIARRLITADTAVLANLVIGEKVVPEFLQEQATVDAIAPALTSVIADSPARQAQVDAFARLDTIMAFGGEDPSSRAARVVLSTTGPCPIATTHRKGAPKRPQIRHLGPAETYLRRETGT